ncbi:MAG: triosephosphate isomerase [Nitrospirales bacterium]|nr:MAG: triosephosphate isomerase [Nitrospirales bacterium]
MLRRFIVGNWKMHKTISQAESLVKDILQMYQPQASVELTIAPSFISLPAVSRLVDSTPIKLAAQNTCANDEGAFTGEISPPMLRDVGCHYVIIGHSERRHIFGETDQDINKKVHAVLHHALLPILCVGERLEERQSNKTKAVIQHQLQTGLKGLESHDFAKITIAYEPVWAIGTGQAATVDQAAEVHGYIRSFISTQWGIKPDQNRIIYGGSVTKENAKSLFQSPQINGALVGKACLDSESFVKIAELATDN